MKILIAEYVCSALQPSGGSLMREACAMLQAICEDASRTGRVTTVLGQGIDCTLNNDVSVHRRVEGQSIAELWANLAEQCDYCLLIAPETDGVLLQHIDALRPAACCLINCPSEFVRIASDKLRSAEALRSAGVPHPQTLLVEDLDCQSEPGQWIIKPRFGCGSEGISWHTHQCRGEQCVHGSLQQNVVGSDWIGQAFHPGQAVSVAAIACGERLAWLPATQQCIAPGGFAYQGGTAPLSDLQNQRAVSLASAAVRALLASCATKSVGGTWGWIGVDLVLGRSVEEDVVIEINPRLTTSYVGLRHLINDNLFAAMIDPLARPLIRNKGVTQVDWDSAGKITLRP